MEGLKEINPQEYADYWQDAPIGMAGPEPKTMEEAMRTPGCCVKSKERESPGSWPRYFGKVCSYSEDKVVIVSYQVHTPLYMWEGTAAQYLDLWNCD